MVPRETQILDAAIEVLGTRGTRHLTHRAVDAEAGLPLGSTSNRFRTREALLAGVLGRVLEREIETWGRLAGVALPLAPDGFATAVAALVRELAGSGRVLTLARYAIFVEAATQPALQRQIAEALERLTAWATPIVAALGSTDPARHLRMLLSLIDGMLANQLANPDPAFDPHAAISALLRGILSP
ncbi:TetR family transcriptional regulator [Actinomycetes bacterium KLBMP 9797]